MKTNNPLRNERCQIAHEHTAFMTQNYAQQIQYAINHTHIYSEYATFENIQDQVNKGIMKVINQTTSKAIIEARKKYPNKTICALNFASFKNPGGGFYNGAMAQEEALCHDSFLYNVLIKYVDDYYTNNRKDLNHSLYYNRALYSKDILFFDESKNSYQTDILTCAAPNYREAMRQGISLEKNQQILKSRSQYILNIATQEQVNILILGAWGCGVFGQDPYTMASIFKELLAYYSFDEVIFAIPKGKNKNDEAFKTLFS